MCRHRDWNAVPLTASRLERFREIAGVVDTPMEMHRDGIGRATGYRV